jgi:two-component system chemotaxis sensor kinase CheA
MDPEQQQLQDAFLSDAEENISAIEALVLMLESDPSDARVIQAIFRAAHTLKGNASCMGLEGYTAVAHAVEEILEQLRGDRRRFNSSLATLLLRSADVLREMTAETVAGVFTLSPAAVALLDDLRTAVSNHAGEGGGEDRAEAMPASPAVAAGGSGVVRVDLRKLERMIDLVGEISLSRGKLARLITDVPANVRGEIDEVHAASDLLFQELRHLVMAARLVVVGPTLRQHKRTVRDLAQKLGKAARLTIRGEEVELDAAIVDRLRDPLTHLVRNAVDHGIEPPHVREQIGKNRSGEVTITARHQAGEVVIEVSDDGRGLDRTQIEQRAREMALPIESTGEREWMRLILRAGFSTAKNVNDVSGRGVGMDVVEKGVESLRGSVEIDSRAGEGTTITMRVPQTLAIFEGLSVGVGADTFIIPLDGVDECADVGRALSLASSEGVIDIRGEAVPFVRLRDYFGCLGDASASEKIVLVHTPTGRAALVVDELHGETEVVVRPLASLLRAAKGLCGSAVLPSGDIGFILEPLPIVKSIIQQAPALH